MVNQEKLHHTEAWDRIEATVKSINATIDKIQLESKILIATIIGGWFITMLTLILIGYHLGNKLDTLSSVIR